MANNAYQRSARREREVVETYRKAGYVAHRTPGSKSPLDVLAVKEGEQPLCIQIKTGGDYAFAGFGPSARTALLEEARRCGGRALLFFYPGSGGGPKILGEKDWPRNG